jgi:hypothetical protein
MEYQTRPLGVTLLALWQFLGAAITVVAAVQFPWVGAPTAWLGPVACLVVLPVVVGLWVGIGLWQLRPWARTVALIFLILDAALKLFSLAAGRFSVLSVIAGVLDMVAIVYLFQPSVRKVFEARPLP